MANTIVAFRERTDGIEHVQSPRYPGEIDPRYRELVLDPVLRDGPRTSLAELEDSYCRYMEGGWPYEVSRSGAVFNLWVRDIYYRLGWEPDREIEVHFS